MRKKIFFIISLALLFALACGPGSSSNSNSNSITSKSITVTVLDDAKNKISNITVVLGNSDGSMVTYGKTDANGEIIFQNSPQNATIAVASSHTYKSTYDTTIYFYFIRNLDISYDVNISNVTFELDIDDIADYELGTVDVTVSSNINTIDHWKLSPYGRIEKGENTSTISIHKYDFQKDSKISFIAIGYDSNDNPLCWGGLLDQTFTDGMDININADNTDFSTITYNLKNIPDIIKSFDGSLDIDRKDEGLTYFNLIEDNQIPIPAAVHTYAIKGIGDSFDYYLDLYLDQNQNNTIGISKHSSILADQDFDFSQAPVIPSNLLITNGETNTPTLLWNGNDASIDLISGYCYIHNDIHNVSTSSVSTSSDLDIHIKASPTRNSIKFPELPDILAEYRPNSIDDFNVYFDEISFITGYDDWLTKVSQYINGTFDLPVEYTAKYSRAEYSTQKESTVKDHKRSNRKFTKR